MATSRNPSPRDWTWRELYVAALMEANDEKMSARIAQAERAILDRVRELFYASADNIEEEQALDDALYALRALKSCLELMADSRLLNRRAAAQDLCEAKHPSSHEPLNQFYAT